MIALVIMAWYNHFTCQNSAPKTACYFYQIFVIEQYCSVFIGVYIIVGGVSYDFSKYILLPGIIEVSSNA